MSERILQTKVGSRTMIKASELQRVIRDGGKSLSGSQKGARTHSNAAVRHGELRGFVKMKRGEPW